MGPREAYRLKRWDAHSQYAVGILLGNLLFAVIMLGTLAEIKVPGETPKWMRSHTPAAVVLPVVAFTGLLTRNGRKHGRRMAREVFYGNLYRITCVYGHDKIGPAEEMWDYQPPHKGS